MRERERERESRCTHSVSVASSQTGSFVDAQESLHNATNSGEGAERLVVEASSVVVGSATASVDVDDEDDAVASVV